MNGGINVITNDTLTGGSFEEYLVNPHSEPLDIQLYNYGNPVTVDVYVKEADISPVRFYNIKISVTEAEIVTIILMFNNGSVSTTRKVIVNNEIHNPSLRKQKKKYIRITCPCYIEPLTHHFY